MWELFLTTIFDYVTALGFYHMQSAHDRDDYVRINWDNIKDKKEHSFKKYDASIIEHFNITYDIGSIMHYGSKAFTKDRRFDTIVPLVSFNVFFRSFQPNLNIYFPQTGRRRCWIDYGTTRRIECERYSQN